MTIIWYDELMKKGAKKTYNLPVLIEKDLSGFYVATVPTVKGCHTQAKTLPELYKRLEEVVKLCVDVHKKDFKFDFPQEEFVDFQKFECANISICI